MHSQSRIRLSLMCHDHEAARFVWDRTSSRALPGIEVCDARYLPPGIVGWDHKVTRTTVTRWVHDRSIPELRPNAREVMRAAGLSDTSDLLTRGLGLSLSDQYWLRPEGATVLWAEVNYFDNGYSPELGEAMLPHDSGSYPTRAGAVGGDAALLASSPDAALGGNLPKRWERSAGGDDVLVKGGKPENRYQEPFNERVATLLCNRILGEGEYVPYELDDRGYLRWTSRCPRMVDASTELVPAMALYRSHRPRNDESLYDFYVRVCAELGLDISGDVSKMLAVDFLLANFDRHWNNFGLLMDSERRAYVGAAPLFDMGECLWCNRQLSEGFGGYHMPAGQPRPFSRDLDRQLPRWCTGQLGWLDRSALEGFPEEAVEVLRSDPIVAAEPGRLDALEVALEERARALCALAEATR